MGRPNVRGPIGDKYRFTGQSLLVVYHVVQHPCGLGVADVLDTYGEIDIVIEVEIIQYGNKIVTSVIISLGRSSVPSRSNINSRIFCIIPPDFRLWPAGES